MTIFRINTLMVALDRSPNLRGMIPPHTEIIGRDDDIFTRDIVLDLKYDFDYWTNRLNESRDIVD